MEGSAKVDIAFGTSVLELVVWNPARGGDAHVDAGHGLVGMRERAALLGGSLDVDASNGASGSERACPTARTPLSPRPVRVLLVDDDDLMRAGLKAVLSSDESLQVIGEEVTAAQPCRPLER